LSGGYLKQASNGNRPLKNVAPAGSGKGVKFCLRGEMVILLGAPKKKR
jgi:hypothetical protein